MAEAFMMRRVGETKKVPVLNASLPADVSGLIESASASASFSVSISVHGVPDEYTYQWYRNSAAISGATGATYTAAFPAAGTYTFYCVVSNAAGSVPSRVAKVVVASAKPVYSYTGSHQLVDDGNYNWRLKLLTSGTLKFTSLGNSAGFVQVFMVGGGGGGYYHAGGGGGYTKTESLNNVVLNTAYQVVIGAGGIGNGSGTGSGGATSIFDFSVNGGKQPTKWDCGGNGGSGGGEKERAGGSNGSDGGTRGWSETWPGTGQHTTTREFAEAGGTLYAGGGGGGKAVRNPPGAEGGAGGGGHGGWGSAPNAPANGDTNTGGGGGGNYDGTNGNGGSGIVVIRNAR